MKSLSVFGQSVHVLIRKPRSLADRLKLFLLYQMVFAIGISGLVGFLGHCLNFEQTARSIGWVPHRQFQFELTFRTLFH
jgi:hypothetical protein